MAASGRPFALRAGFPARPRWYIRSREQGAAAPLGVM